MNTLSDAHQRLDAWVDTHFDEQVSFLQQLLRVPTDTPPGNNAPHAERAADLLDAMGLATERHPVPQPLVQAAGLQTITNLVVKRRYGPSGASGVADATDGKPWPIVALNAHGDVVPPGEGWTYDPYGGTIVDGKIYGRAAAVSKCDFSTYAYAVRALEALRAATPIQLRGGIDLLFTYDEEFGGEVGPQWLLEQGHTRPDLLIAAGFSYQVITAHNGCLQLEVTVHGTMAHAAIPTSGVDALQAAVHILQALYRQNTDYRNIHSKVEGITHPYLNVGLIEGGTNTNVVPGTVRFKLDRRMIPEENPAEVEAQLRNLIGRTAAECAGITVDIRRMLLAHAMRPLPGNVGVVRALQHHAAAVFGEPIPAVGTPLYTDARLFAERGIPAVIYGAGPRTVRESNAKRADEHLDLKDLRRATQVVARTLLDLLQAPHALVRPA